MAKRKPETEVGSYSHPEATRKNIPTAETERFMADEEAAPKKLRWPRNPDLDPQLVWRGKDWQGDLEVPVVPVYIQEKIHPQAIIEDLPADGGAGQERWATRPTCSPTSTACPTSRPSWNSTSTTSTGRTG